MKEFITCKVCLKPVAIDYDLNVINGEHSDKSAIMGWCSNCGSIYTRSVLDPYDARWRKPKTMSVGA